MLETNRIMSFKDVAGDIERSTISFPVHPGRMRRIKLVAHLLHNDCILLREGAKHSIYRNLLTGVQTSVPRHASLLESTARAICRQLGVSWPLK